VGTPAPLPHHPQWHDNTRSLWLSRLCTSSGGSTYLAIRIGIESFSTADPGGTPPHKPWACSCTLFFEGRRGSGPPPPNWRTAAVAGALLLFVGNGGVSWAEQDGALRYIAALLVGHGVALGW